MNYRVLVLGSGIIGKQVKIAATKMGYDVATVDIKGATYTIDLRDQEEYLEVLHDWQPNVIFNTAGKDQKLGDNASPLHEMKDSDWKELFGHNTDLLFNVARTSLAYFIESNKQFKKLIFTPSTYSFTAPNPNFYNEDSQGSKGYQLLANSPAINSGIPYTGRYSHPVIKVNDSDIFSSIQATPTVDFFGRSLNVNSTPNIGANNAKNGEITSLYDNDKSPFLATFFANDKIIFKNIKSDYKYKLFNVVGKEIENGIIKGNNPTIAFEQNIKNGVYEVILENKNGQISSKFIVHKSHTL